ERAVRLWGTDGRIELAELADPASSTSTKAQPKRHRAAKPKVKQQQRKAVPGSQRRHNFYLFGPSKRSELNDADIVRLEGTEPEALLAQLRQRTAANADISFGEFRLFVEASLYWGESALLAETFALVEHSPHCIPFLVEILIEEANQIPTVIHETARQW